MTRYFDGKPSATKIGTAAHKRIAETGLYPHQQEMLDWIKAGGHRSVRFNDHYSDSWRYGRDKHVGSLAEFNRQARASAPMLDGNRKVHSTVTPIKNDDYRGIETTWVAYDEAAELDERILRSLESKHQIADRLARGKVHKEGPMSILDIKVVDAPGGAVVELKAGSMMNYQGYQATAPEIDRLIAELGKARDQVRSKNRPSAPFWKRPY